jgi:hypothetical protein
MNGEVAFAREKAMKQFIKTLDAVPGTTRTGGPTRSRRRSSPMSRPLVD